MGSSAGSISSGYAAVSTRVTVSGVTLLVASHNLLIETIDCGRTMQHVVTYSIGVADSGKGERCRGY